MDARDPYQAPGAPFKAKPQPDPAAMLFTLSGIAIATFLGSIFAGGILMAANYRALGQPDRARKTLWLSGLASVAVVAISLASPEKFPSVVIVIPQLIVVMQLSKQHQGAAILAREQAGQAMRSNWSAAGISLLVVLGLVATLAVVFFALQAFGISALDDAA